jgi:hypothetical protein
MINPQIENPMRTTCGWCPRLAPHGVSCSKLTSRRQQGIRRVRSFLHPNGSRGCSLPLANRPSCQSGSLNSGQNTKCRVCLHRTGYCKDRWFAMPCATRNRAWCVQAGYHQRGSRPRFLPREQTIERDGVLRSRRPLGAHRRVSVGGSIADVHDGVTGRCARVSLPRGGVTRWLPTVVLSRIVKRRGHLQAIEVRSPNADILPVIRR